MTAHGKTVLKESVPYRGRMTADEKGCISLSVHNPGPDQPVALALTFLPPMAERGDPANVVLFSPGKTEILAVDGAVGTEGVAIEGCAGGSALAHA